MGLFDFFKKKPVEESNPAPLTSFQFYYLYGFTDSPNQTAANPTLVIELYQQVIGPSGGIAIPNSYHPYFIINPKGTSVWNAAYVKLNVNPDKDVALKRIADSQAVCVIDTSAMFTQLNIWPDTRLTESENPLFNQYVPFVIPFLVYGTNPVIEWAIEIAKGVQEGNHASEYVSKVTEATRFLMPSPAFVVGFDEFDESRPSKLIDNFINFKMLLER